MTSCELKIFVVKVKEFNHHCLAVLGKVYSLLHASMVLRATVARHACSGPDSNRFTNQWIDCRRGTEGRRKWYQAKQNCLWIKSRKPSCLHCWKEAKKIFNYVISRNIGLERVDGKDLLVRDDGRTKCMHIKIRKTKCLKEWRNSLSQVETWYLEWFKKRK